MPADDQRREQEAREEQQQVAPISLGQVLRSARESRKLSLEQVAAELRMEPGLLVALEENRFEALGAPVFVKGYLRHYGQRLGLDYEQLHSRYQRQAAPQDVPVVPRRTIELGGNSHRTGWAVAGGAAVLVLLALAVWWLASSDEGARLAPWVRTTPTDLSVLPDQDAPVVDPIALPTPAARSSPAAVTAGDAGDPGTAGDGAAEEPAADPDSAEVTPEDVAGAEAPEPGVLQIELTAEEDCWTEVSDGRGERRFYGLVDAGESIRLTAEPPVSVLLGNAQAVRLFVDGRAYPLPRDGRRGNMARFTLYGGEL